ncbi:hypothetical protein [Georgenia alba]|uniref:DUF4352 domain-containing protein n=1 Tax=Georgenia alba TaxID=2233858 RepID=A0ABW2Q9W4_9MICO
MPSLRWLRRYAREHPVVVLAVTLGYALLALGGVAWASGPDTYEGLPPGVDEIAVGEEHRNGEMSVRVRGAHLVSSLPGYSPFDESNDVVVLDLEVENLLEEPIIDPFQVAALHPEAGPWVRDYTLLHLDGSRLDAFQPALPTRIRLVYEVRPDAIPAGQDVVVSLWDRRFVEEAGYLPGWRHPEPTAALSVPVQEGGL